MNSSDNKKFDDQVNGERLLKRSVEWMEFDRLEDNNFIDILEIYLNDFLLLKNSLNKNHSAWSYIEKYNKENIKDYSLNNNSISVDIINEQEKLILENISEKNQKNLCQKFIDFHKKQFNFRNYTGYVKKILYAKSFLANTNQQNFLLSVSLLIDVQEKIFIYHQSLIERLNKAILQDDSQQIYYLLEKIQKTLDVNLLKIGNLDLTFEQLLNQLFPSESNQQTNSDSNYDSVVLLRSFGLFAKNWPILKKILVDFTKKEDLDNQLGDEKLLFEEKSLSDALDITLNNLDFLKDHNSKQKLYDLIELFPNNVQSLCKELLAGLHYDTKNEKLIINSSVLQQIKTKLPSDSVGKLIEDLIDILDSAAPYNNKDKTRQLSLVVDENLKTQIIKIFKENLINQLLASSIKDNRTLNSALGDFSVILNAIKENLKGKDIDEFFSNFDQIFNEFLKRENNFQTDKDLKNFFKEHNQLSNILEMTELFKVILGSNSFPLNSLLDIFSQANKDKELKDSLINLIKSSSDSGLSFYTRFPVLLNNLLNKIGNNRNVVSSICDFAESSLISMELALRNSLVLKDSPQNLFVNQEEMGQLNNGNNMSQEITQLSSDKSLIIESGRDIINSNIFKGILNDILIDSNNGRITFDAILNLTLKNNVALANSLKKILSSISIDINNQNKILIQSDNFFNGCEDLLNFLKSQDQNKDNIQLQDQVSLYLSSLGFLKNSISSGKKIIFDREKFINDISVLCQNNIIYEFVGDLLLNKDHIKTVQINSTDHRQNDKNFSEQLNKFQQEKNLLIQKNNELQKKNSKIQKEKEFLAIDHNKLLNINYKIQKENTFYKSNFANNFSLHEKLSSEKSLYKYTLLFASSSALLAGGSLCVLSKSVSQTTSLVKNFQMASLFMVGCCIAGALFCLYKIVKINNAQKDLVQDGNLYKSSKSTSDFPSSLINTADFQPLLKNSSLNKRSCAAG